jgi:hypothetical protein
MLISSNRKDGAEMCFRKGVTEAAQNTSSNLVINTMSEAWWEFSNILLTVIKEEFCKLHEIPKIDTLDPRLVKLRKMCVDIGHKRILWNINRIKNSMI